MNIAFMGSDPIALPMLDFIQSADCAHAKISMVFTQPDRKTGRGMHLRANAIKAWALANDIEVLQPAKCGATEAEILASRGIDLVLVMAYGQILPRCILHATPNKVLNVHASLLPRLRGASPIHTGVAVGLQQTGVSLMEIVPKMDAGPVALQETVDIRHPATAPEVIVSMANAAVALIRRGLNDLVEGRLVFREQDPAAVSYCRIIEKTDCHLDFNRPAAELCDRIRAFQPWPGTSFLHSDLEIRILKADIQSGSEPVGHPGRVCSSGSGIRIACGEDFLVPLLLQRPGGRALPADEFLRGFEIRAGEVLSSREMRPLESKTPFPFRKR